jgi:hypothetical protein
MNTARGGLAQSVQVRLARHAKQIGVDPNLVLTRYGAERFLYRLSRSPHSERFVSISPNPVNAPIHAKP